MSRQHGAVRLTRRFVVYAMLAGTALTGACRAKPGDEAEPELNPIEVHVKNENFLDMNVYSVVGGVSRRLGTVTGNGSGDYTIRWSSTGGQPVAVTAVPIGGSGSASTGQLNVSPGQIIEFRVAALLRQSSVSIHAP